MSDNYFDESKQSKLAYWGLGQMLRGGAYAAVLLIVIGVTMGAIYAVGLLLPAESRETPDPMPRSSLEQPLAAPGHALI